MSTDVGPLKVIELRAQDVKAIKAVTIRPEGHVVPIKGRNGAGKSTALDCLLYAMGGKSVLPPEPVRRGADEGRIELDLGAGDVPDVCIKWRYTREGKFDLVVSERGVPKRSPQTVLNQLFKSNTIDPIRWWHMAPAERMAGLKDLAELTDLYAKLDAERDAAYHERHKINQDARALKAQIQGMPEVEAPDEEVSLAELTERCRAATAQVRENDKIRNQGALLGERICEAERHLARLKANRDDALRQQNTLIERLKRDLREAEKQREVIQEEHTASVDQASNTLLSYDADRQSLDAEIEELVDPDVEAITAELQGAEATNARVRQNRERAAKVAIMGDLEGQSFALTQRIEEIDEQKRRALSEAKLPVEGLGFGESDITLNGLPFEQASTAEAIRASVGLAVAQNPRFRAVLVREGNVLDSQSRELLYAAIAEHDGQLWIEYATDGDVDNVGFVIEDGEVKGA